MSIFLESQKNFGVKKKENSIFFAEIVFLSLRTSQL